MTKTKPTYEELEQRIAMLESRQPATMDEWFGTTIAQLPVMAHSIDGGGRIIEVSDLWLKKMGYQKEEVIGRPSVSFLTEASKTFAAEKALPKFFADGFIENVPYQFIRKDGTVIDVLLSAISLLTNDAAFDKSVAIMMDISERRKAEHALRDSERRFRTLTALSPGGIYLTDPDGDCVYANEAWLDMARMTLDEAMGDGWQNGLHPDDRKTIGPAWYKMVESGGQWGHEYRFQNKDGKTVWVYGLARAIQNDAGEITGYLGLNIDITDRKKAERHILQSHRRLKTLFHDSPIPLWDEDFTQVFSYLNGLRDKGIVDFRDYFESHPDAVIDCAQAVRVLDVNQATLNLHEASSKQDLFGNLEKLFTENSLIGFREELIALANGETEIEIEGEVQTLTGAHRHVNLKLTLIMESDGKVRALVATTDITERKHADEALRNSEEKYRELVELAQEGIWAIDQDGNTQFVNQSMAKMLGYTVEEMYGSHLFSFMDESDVTLATDNLERREQGITEQHDFVFRHKDGHRVITAIETAPILDESGTYTGAIAGVLDITERKKAEMEKERLQIQLAQAQKMESIGNLAGGIAHDFNNILASIIGFTELAIEDADKNSLIEEHLQEIFIAGTRAKEMVKQILAFARQSDVEVKPLRVASVVKEALLLLRSSTPTTIDIQPTIQSNALIMGNATQMQQVVLNLCTNAVHATEDTGGVIEVTLNDTVIDDQMAWESLGLPMGRYIELVITDSGTGISDDIKHAIFEPYFTTKAQGKGTGMGLAMVKGIVDSYGGKIDMTSAPGGPTRFRILLPATKKRKKTIADTPEELPVGDERILFVDDEAPIAKIGGRILERLGYTVTTRTSSVDALALFRERPDAFDLVITDMTMPNMAGDAMAVEMQAIRPGIPIILCTGYSNQISESIARNIGIDAFAYKPLVKADLAKTIRAVLDANPGSNGATG